MSYITEPPGSVRFSHSRARGIFQHHGRKRLGGSLTLARGEFSVSRGGELVRRQRVRGSGGALRMASPGNPAAAQSPGRFRGKDSAGPSPGGLLWKEPHLFLMADAPVPSLSV